MFRMVTKPVLEKATAVYQKYVSTHKGYHCAHAQHRGGETCSCYIRRVLNDSKLGDLEKKQLIVNRLESCHATSEVTGFSLFEAIQVMLKRHGVLAAICFFASAQVYAACGGSSGGGGGCGGGGGSGSLDDCGKIQHKVELGLISSATVTIYSQDKASVLASMTTDKTGVFSIDKATLDATRTRLSVTSPLVWIEASGGYDLDPNDDGVLEPGEAVPLQGKVTAIVPYARLVSEQGFKFNLITSAIADLLSNSDDLTVERLDQLASQVVIPDINKDTKQSLTDALYYQMGSFSSSEEALREFYLTQIHANDQPGRNLSVDLIKENIDTVRIEENKQLYLTSITLHPLNKGSQIYYSKNYFIPHTQMLPAGYKPGSSISLSDGESITFQECMGPSLEYCYKRQSYTANISGSSLYLTAPINSPYQDPKKVAEIIQKTRESEEKLQNSISDADRTKGLADYYTQQANQNQQEIDELRKQLEKL